MSDLQSDLLSTRELSISDTYHLDTGFHPSLVVDGGGNIGLFTLRAAAAFLRNGEASPRFVVCEPIPGNVEQIRKHLDSNHIPAKVMPVCLGGARQTITFYQRDAHESSFSPEKPFRAAMEIPVLPLSEIVGSSPEERILIKLDIEGMEVETLASFLPGEQRAIYLVGELHNFAENAPVMQQMFSDHHWSLEFFDTANGMSLFRGCSPAARPLLPGIFGNTTSVT